jgi:hypothetical protein
LRNKPYLIHGDNNMGHVPYLMKPNLTAIYGATTVYTGTGNAAYQSASVVHLHGATLNNVLPQNEGEFGAIRTDWLVITSGAYSGRHWRVKAWTTDLVTVDGDIPSDLASANWGIYNCVDARCKWTDPTTVTYIKLEPTSVINESFEFKLNVIRYANAGSVAINLRKTAATKMFPLGYVGNYLDSEIPASVQCVQLKKAIDYAGLNWPSTSPKYSNILWYNGYALTTHRDVYDIATSVYRKERAYILKCDKEEDQFNNLSLKSLAVELV